MGAFSFFHRHHDPSDETESKKSEDQELPEEEKSAESVQPKDTPQLKLLHGGRTAEDRSTGTGALQPEAAEETVCREAACESMATTGQYCRLHYIKNWTQIKHKEALIRDGVLHRYITELVEKFPPKYIDALRADLKDDDTFMAVIHELDLQESDEELEEIEGPEDLEGIPAETAGLKKTGTDD